VILKIAPVALALLLASRGTAHADDDIIGYLNALKQAGVEATNGGSNADLIKGGMYICAELSAGKSQASVTRQVYTLSNLSSLTQAATVVSDAITYLCPGNG